MAKKERVKTNPMGNEHRHTISVYYKFSMRSLMLLLYRKHTSLPCLMDILWSWSYPKVSVKKIYHDLFIQKSIRSRMDLEHNQRKQGLSRSWPMQPMQPCWENDVAAAVDKALIDCPGSERNIIAHCIVQSTFIAPCSSPHLLIQQPPFASIAPVTVLLSQDLKKP